MRSLFSAPPVRSNTGKPSNRTPPIRTRTSGKPLASSSRDSRHLDAGTAMVWWSNTRPLASVLNHRTVAVLLASSRVLGKSRTCTRSPASCRWRRRSFSSASAHTTQRQCEIITLRGCTHTRQYHPLRTERRIFSWHRCCLGDQGRAGHSGATPPISGSLSHHPHNLTQSAPRKRPFCAFSYWTQNLLHGGRTC